MACHHQIAFLPKEVSPLGQTDKDNRVIFQELEGTHELCEGYWSASHNAGKPKRLDSRMADDLGLKHA